MMKYIYLLIGVALIMGGYEVLNAEMTFYTCGVLFITGGIGGILIGE